jgi:single-stranded DNA-binding protein
LALRVGISEDYVQKLLGEFEEEGVLIIDRWTDDNGTNHDMYQVVVDVVKENQRPEQKSHVKRPPYYKVKRGANKGSFSHANQPGKNREVREMDDEE